MKRIASVVALCLAAGLLACAPEGGDSIEASEGAIQVEKRTALEIKQEVSSARESAKELRQHAARLTNQSNASESAPALDDLRRVSQSVRQAVQRLREKLLSPQAQPGSRFARVPEEELKRVMDQLADINDAYLEQLEEELPSLAAKIRAGKPIAEVERDAVIVHVLDVIHNLNFALRTINEWIAEADNVAVARCAGSNRWGSFPAGGTCTIFGCSPAGGACNLFGCFRPGGECNLHSCTNEIEPGEVLCRPR
jgi:hypothetical protein